MIALLLMLITAAFAADLPVDSQVSEVTVYLDRARVTRTTTVDVPVGTTSLVMEGLPIQLITASLAAEGEGTAGATITGIDVRPERGVEDRDERMRVFQADKRTVEDEIRVQRDQLARIQADLAFVKALQPKAPEKLQESLFLADDAAAQMAALARQIGSDVDALLAEQRAAEIRIRELERENGRIDREIAQLSSAGNQDSVRVAVGLDAARAGRVTVRLQYVVPGAGWVPHYDARYRLADGGVRLELSGEVRQSTGEDWRDVKLVLSTARPQQGTAPPQLTPFVLQEGYGGPADKGGPGGAVVADRVTAFEFGSRTREDVLADGTVRRVFLRALDLKGETVHQVVARRVEAAWLTARVVNEADFPLMAGAVSSYLGTAYVGEGHVPLTPPGEQIDLSFGVDDRVGVKRVRLEQKAGDKPLTNKERIRYGWKTTVKNHTGRAIDLRVIEQVPVSREAAFEVTTTTTPPTAIPSTGVFEWTTKLASGQSQDFVLEYEVVWPAGDRPVLME